MPGLIVARRSSTNMGEFTFSVTVNTITVNTSVPKVQFPNICGDKESKQSFVNMHFPLSHSNECSEHTSHRCPAPTLHTPKTQGLGLITTK